MNPKRRKQLVEEYASEIGEDKELIDKVVRSYYACLQKKLSSCEHTAVNVPELGVFYALDYRVDKKIKRLKAVYHSIEPTSSLKTYSLANNLRNQLITLEEFKVKIDTEKERRKEIKSKRYENRDNQDTQSSL